jgi:hypothetical protein
MQASNSARIKGKTIEPEFRKFFAAADRGDTITVNKMFWNLARRNGLVDADEGLFNTNDQMRLTGTQWEAAREIWGTFKAFTEGDEKYSAAFGDDIIKSIPEGSIYFGGSDPGRFVITAMCKSQIDGNPFFVLTQNALADGAYLNYLREMYGGKIYTPTPEDSANCFNQYYTNATSRYQHDHQFPDQPKQLKPGEGVNLDPETRKLNISGQVSIMQVNALMVKVIFDKNPDREFFIEESYPLDWMYPYLEPHGLIMKINRQPMAELPEDLVDKDREYWSKYIQPMIGDWLHKETALKEIAEFAEKAYGPTNLHESTWDPLYVQSNSAKSEFSRLRVSIAGLYAWRAQSSTNDVEKKRMNEEADFAFRQAWALCPYSMEVVYCYINLLASENRLDDCLLLAQTAFKLNDDVDQKKNLQTVADALVKAIRAAQTNIISGTR